MNETHIYNDILANDLFIDSDAYGDEVPVWIQNEDGTGYWSDGWDIDTNDH